MINWVCIMLFFSVCLPPQSSPWTAPLAVGWPHSECSDNILLLMSCVSSTPPDRSNRNHTYTTQRKISCCCFINCNQNTEEKCIKPMGNFVTWSRYLSKWWHTAYSDECVYLGTLHMVAALIFLNGWLAVGTRFGVGQQPQAVSSIFIGLAHTCHCEKHKLTLTTTNFLHLPYNKFSSTHIWQYTWHNVI